MIFLINHDTGVTENANHIEEALRLIDEWIKSGTDEEDISLYKGERLNFAIRTIKKSYIPTSFKTN